MQSQECRAKAAGISARVFVSFGLRLGAAILTAGVAGCKQEAPPVAQAQPVQAMTVSLIPRAESWSYVGTLRARYQSDLGFRVGGKITARLVNVGDAVKAGEPLARLDPTDLRLAVEAQEAELRAALSSREQAVAAETRNRALIDRGHIARATLDQRIAAADEARARVERAERSLSLARNQLDYAELRADRDGVVSDLPVEVGQVVAAGQLVARVARLDSIEAVVAVPEHKVEAARAAAATVEMWNGSGRRLAAHLREMAPEADRASRTYQARFSIDAPDADVRLGRTVTVRLSGGEGGEIAQAPLSAIMNDGRGASVWLIEPDGQHVRRAPVEIASLGPVYAAVSSGLAAGDRIVTLGVHMLDEGKLIRVIEKRADLR